MDKYQKALNKLKNKTNKPVYEYYKDKQGLNHSRIIGYENEDCDLLQELLDLYKESLTPERENNNE